MTPYSDYTTLNSLLSSDARSALERERTAFDEIAGDELRPLVLCGAGELGRRILAGLVTLGRVPVAFTDNNATLWGMKVDGVNVLSPTDVAAKFKEMGIRLTQVAQSIGVRFSHLLRSGERLDRMARDRLLQLAGRAAERGIGKATKFTGRT